MLDSRKMAEKDHQSLSVVPNEIFYLKNQK